MSNVPLLLNYLDGNKNSLTINEMKLFVIARFLISKRVLTPRGSLVWEAQSVKNLIARIKKLDIFVSIF
jgi:hypothetical protein